MMERNVNANWLGTCRGIAVIGVILTHLLPYIDSKFELHSEIIRAITVDIIDTGKIGVALLFMIAGFLAFASKKKRTVKQFVINRFFRLYPLYWLDIALVGIIFAFDNYDLDTIIANITMLQVFFHKEDLVGVFWTLPIELMLYLGAIFFEKYIWNYKKVLFLELIGALGSIVIAIVRKTIWASAPVAIGLLLTIGLLGQIFRLYKNDEVSIKHLNIAIFIFETCLICSSLLAYQSDNGYQENWHRYVLSYSFAVIIFTVFFVTKKNFSPLAIIAEIAYPIYLLQEIVFRVAFNKIWQQEMDKVLFICGMLLALIGVSFIVHVLIERPAIIIGNKIEKKLTTGKNINTKVLSCE